mmetsp:Transcript_56135/g.162612  ORF Transcript_56135/g.162612 Transcript_56135/m.162612 type:complete len:204 (-) Transcript_56135:175-786(-)
MKAFIRMPAGTTRTCMPAAATSRMCRSTCGKRRPTQSRRAPRCTRSSSPSACMGASFCRGTDRWSPRCSTCASARRWCRSACGWWRGSSTGTSTASASAQLGAEGASSLSARANCPTGRSRSASPSASAAASTPNGGASRSSTTSRRIRSGCCQRIPRIGTSMRPPARDPRSARSRSRFLRRGDRPPSRRAPWRRTQSSLPRA